MKISERIGDIFFNTIPLVLGGGVVGVIITESHLNAIVLCAILFILSILLFFIGLLFYLKNKTKNK